MRRGNTTSGSGRGLDLAASVAPAPPRARVWSSAFRRRSASRGAPRFAAVPRPLLALLAVVALFGVSWALLDPPWQGPDEDVHFSYVQTVAEQHRLPGGQGASLSSAQFDAMQSMNNDPVVFFSYARPEWSKLSYEQWKQRARSDGMKDSGGPNAASTYPPAYYLSLVPAYNLAGSSDVVTHLYAARLFSVLWLLVTTTAVWLLVGELFGRRRDLQIVGAAAVGLWPMIDFLSSSVNPDSAMYATWALSLWLGTRIIRRGLTVGSALGFGASVGLALVVKAPSLALVPAAAFVVLYGVLQLLRRRAFRRALVGGALAVLVFVVLVGAWKGYVGSHNRLAYTQATGVTSRVHNLREFASYVWEYYLPKLPFQHHVRFSTSIISDYPAYGIWVATGWAAFGWVTVFFPMWAYPIFLAITVLIGLGGLGAALRFVARAGGPARLLRSSALAVAVFFAMAAGALILGLHWAEYLAHYPTLQGRYLFPLAGIAAVFVAGAITLLPRRFQRTAVASVLGLLVVFQLFSLGLVAMHFYA